MNLFRVFKENCMLRIVLVLVTGIFLIGGTCYGNETDLQIISLEDAPLSFTNEKGEVDGLSVELVNEIIKRIKLTSGIRILPWARGYEMLNTQNNIVLFGTVRTEERENLFKWVGPIVVTKLKFYARKDSHIKINSLEDAQKVKRIGTTIKFFSEQILKKAGFKNLDSAPYPEMGLKKLLKGRVDLWPALNVTVPPLLDKVGADTNDIEEVFTIKTMYDYIAFSKETPDVVINQWQDTLSMIKKDGTFQRIYRKWYPKDENVDDLLRLLEQKEFGK